MIPGFDKARAMRRAAGSTHGMPELGDDLYEMEEMQRVLMVVGFTRWIGSREGMASLSHGLTPRTWLGSGRDRVAMNKGYVGRRFR